jgi:hypothetical protein
MDAPAIGFKFVNLQEERVVLDGPNTCNEIAEKWQELMNYKI